MSTMVPMYGFGGSGGKGAALTVNAPAGCTVTVSKDGKTKTKVAGTDGVAVFKGLATGTWTLTITDGIHTSTKPVVITADYSAVIAFFSATINVTYPAGSTCKATNGSTTLTAPDTSGTWACVVPNAGTWTVSCTNGSETEESSVEITGEGQSASVVLDYEFKVLKVVNGFSKNMESTNQTSEYSMDGDTATFSTYGEGENQANVKFYGNIQIDVTDYNTLTMHVKNNSNQCQHHIGLYSSVASPYGWIDGVATMSFTEKACDDDITIDVSSVTGNNYFAVSMSNLLTSVEYVVEISNVRLWK